jgi:serine protease AprX
MKKLLFSLILIGIGISTSAQSWQNKIDERLDIYDGSSAKFEFLIQFVEQGDIGQAKFLTDKTAKGTLVMERLQENAKKSQANVMQILEQKNAPFQSFWVANVIWVYADYKTVETLAQRSNMKIIEPIPALDDLNKTPETPWGIVQMNVDDVWEMGIKGKGVVIGGQDTGYDWEHEALKNKYRGWDGTTADHNYNWHDAIHDYDPKHQTQNNLAMMAVTERILWEQ